MTDFSLPLATDIYKPQTFAQGFAFAEKHMSAVRKELGSLPLKLFIDIDTAPAKRDMEEATDLILSVNGGDIAVRVRRNKFWLKGLRFGFDLSIRAECRGHKTEIDKLQEGFGKWYFYGYSSNDSGGLVEWWLLDLDTVRGTNILTGNYPVYPNGDGTAGKYIPLDKLDELDCVIAHKRLTTE